MTKTQFKKKIASMKKDISRYIDQESLRLFDSGAIDTASYEDGYLLPSVILSAVFKNLMYQHEPHCIGKKLKKEIDNLNYF